MRLLGSIRRNKHSPTLAYVECEDSHLVENFRINTLLSTSRGTQYQHVHYINMIETKSTTDDDGTVRDGSEINTSNIMTVTEEHLSNVQKEQLAQVVDGFKTACL